MPITPCTFCGKDIQSRKLRSHELACGYHRALRESHPPSDWAVNFDGSASHFDERFFNECVQVYFPGAVFARGESMVAYLDFRECETQPKGNDLAWLMALQIPMLLHTEIEDSPALLEKLKPLPGEDENGRAIMLDDFFRTCGNIREGGEPPHDALSRHAKIGNEFLLGNIRQEPFYTTEKLRVMSSRNKQLLTGVVLEENAGKLHPEVINRMRPQEKARFRQTGAEFVAELGFTENSLLEYLKIQLGVLDENRFLAVEYLLSQTHCAFAGLCDNSTSELDPHHICARSGVPLEDLNDPSTFRALILASTADSDATTPDDFPCDPELFLPKCEIRSRRGTGYHFDHFHSNDSALQRGHQLTAAVGLILGDPNSDSSTSCKRGQIFSARTHEMAHAYHCAASSIPWDHSSKYLNRSALKTFLCPEGLAHKAHGCGPEINCPSLTKERGGTTTFTMELWEALQMRQQRLKEAKLQTPHDCAKNDQPRVCTWHLKQGDMYYIPVGFPHQFYQSVGTSVSVAWDVKAFAIYKNAKHVIQGPHITPSMAKMNEMMIQEQHQGDDETDDLENMIHYLDHVLMPDTDPLVQSFQKEMKTFSDVAVKVSTKRKKPMDP